MEGTYPLPEAQLDRFLFKIDIYRNSVEVLETIVNHREMGAEVEVEPVMTRDELLALMTLTRRMYLPAVVANYIARLVDATHPGQSPAAGRVKYGASPRAALGMAAAAKAAGLLAGRINASFEDVQSVAVPVLQHRVVMDYQARLDGETGAKLAERLLEEIPAHDGSLPNTITTTAAS